MMLTDAKGPPGAAKLLAYIRERFGTIPKFCDATGLDRFKVQKAIRGDLKRVDVDFALDAERATDGAVVVHDWATGPEEAPPQSEGSAAQ